jgi:hypothetical protein
MGYLATCHAPFCGDGLQYCGSHGTLLPQNIHLVFLKEYDYFARHQRKVVLSGEAGAYAVYGGESYHAQE